MSERMSDLEAEARRDAIHWRRKYEELYDAVEALVDAWDKFRDPKFRAAWPRMRDLRRVWHDESEEG